MTEDLKEMTLAELGQLRAGLRAKLKTVSDEVQSRVLDALKDGRSEAEVAREAKVDRMTVRKWQGKK